MDTRVGPALQDLLVEGTRERGYRAAGTHFYTWQEERAEARAWVEELSPFDRRGARDDAPTHSSETPEPR